MTNFSVNTNVGAFVALQNLSQTNRGLEVTQNRINTGLKVSSTKDDSGTYAIAQSLRADIGGLNAVKTSLDRAKSTLDVAVSAAESMSDILIQMKEKATAAADKGMDVDSRKALQDDFNKLSEQLTTYLNSAEFNGSNILRKSESNLNALLNPDDLSQVISIPNLTLNAPVTTADDALTTTVYDPVGGGALHPFIGDTTTAGTKATAVVITTWADPATGAAGAEASLNKVNYAIDSMKTVLSTLGSASRQIDAQLTFTTKLSDTIETGIGNLVDADLAKESARLQALQTKQQLGLQALAIANQAPQSIMSLFRN